MPTWSRLVGQSCRLGVDAGTVSLLSRRGHRPPVSRNILGHLAGATLPNKQMLAAVGQTQLIRV